ESPSLLDIDGFRASDADNVFPIYGEGNVWDLKSSNVKETLHSRGGFHFMWKSITGDITLERLRDPLSTSEGGCIISHPSCIGKNQIHHSISSVISEDVSKVSACGGEIMHLKENPPSFIGFSVNKDPENFAEEIQ
ncbi:hypothetical protein H5410_003944, partial [Solanum commersonii]